MKKKIVAMATGLIIVGTASTQTSAEEYQVEKGDTLWEIARENQIEVDDLKEANNLATNIILPRQLLQIDKEIVYTVEAGDTLTEIAEKHHVSIEDLKEWNELSSDLILVDQELVVTETRKSNDDTKQKAEKATTQPQPKSTPTPTQTKSTPKETKSTQQKTLTVTATAYTADCAGCSGITATGIDLRNDRDKKVIAVDPNVIPLGTRVYVEGYGEAIAGDTGGAIKGNKIDLHVPTKDEAYQWGVRKVNVTILG
ncbi:LysM peptidoglycan-binding and 3D domain-containing protein [Paraliobacillus salinarum]|uniref:LysM peptidoglycan-binding and 3D domain-containing protein n=1 Tax=Paraliobacillus salinarum TaxID=1158996 RepID=UPI0015F75243|nr:3D domain-containing protein [Paraliobacillus salinarum]